MKTMSDNIDTKFQNKQSQSKVATPGQKNFFQLLELLLGPVTWTLRNYFLARIGKRNLEPLDFIQKNQSEIRQLSRKHILNSYDIRLLFPSSGCLANVHNWDCSVLCKLLLNIDFELSEKDRNSIQNFKNTKRWIMALPKVYVSDSDFVEKRNRISSALRQLKHFEEEKCSNVSLHQTIKTTMQLLFDDATEALRRAFMARTNNDPDATVERHRSLINRLLSKKILNERQWHFSTSSGTFDVEKANISQLCTLLQNVCGDIPLSLSKTMRKLLQLRQSIVRQGRGTQTNDKLNAYRIGLYACIGELQNEGTVANSATEENIVKSQPPQIHPSQHNKMERAVITELVHRAGSLVRSNSTESESAEVDLYFQTKGKFGGPVPIQGSTPTPMTACRLCTSDCDSTTTEKQRTENPLRTAAATNKPHINMLREYTKKRQCIAIPVVMSKTDNNKIEMKISKQNKLEKDVGEGLDLCRYTADAVPRYVKFLPSRVLPWPQIDMEMVVEYVQHDPLDIIFVMMTTSKPPGPQITMKYELLRLCTYRNFPVSDKPYSIRLASAGFYYAGEDDELTCYCCGQRRSCWTSKDVPFNVHRMISPGCAFFTKNLDVNVPVPHPPDSSPIRPQIGDAQQENGAYGQTAAMASASAPVIAEVKGSLPSDTSSMLHQTAAQNTERRKSDNMATSHTKQTQHVADTNISANVDQALVQRTGLGIDFERPKHSQFAVKALRLQSFDNWPRNVRQTPAELAEAGMYYAGFGDCVRCFFCGIGLRHWSEEDNPWIEHARWSPMCVFLRQVKGVEFVDLVQLAVQYNNEEDENISGNSESSSTNEPVVRQQPPQDDDTPTCLLTDAAQSVLEMGYQPRMVQRAIDTVMKQKGREHLTASSIMEHVLELEEAEAATKVQRGIESMSLNTSESSATKNTACTDAEKKVDTKMILQQNKVLKDQTMCKVCLDNPVCIVFLPCGHLVTCAECAPAMRKCPICRTIVKGTVKTYMA